MIAYDIDGVLAEKPPAAIKAWGKMTGNERKERKQFLLAWYRDAQPLYQPTEPFTAISARKEEDAIHETTRLWFEQHYPNMLQHLILLPVSRSIENVVRFKSAAIELYEVTEFTEDNKKILKGLAQNNLGCKLWYWEKGMTERLAYNLK